VYDVVIVGAGPAGSTLARLLAPRLRVLLVEKRRLLDWRTQSSPEKPCGGLLAPDAQAALAELGLGVPREILVGPQLFAVRAVDATSGLERHYPRSYLNVERGRFDAWLLSLAGAAEVRMGCLLRALRPGPGGVTVELDAPGRIETVRRASSWARTGPPRASAGSPTRTGASRRRTSPCRSGGRSATPRLRSRRSSIPP
jgi:geranylgeranyl diphosphate/geranylgeranyl-bacteriochlorophyllide a reductase